jgi:hypothetical protein
MHQTCVQILDSPWVVGPRAAEFQDTNESVESHLGGREKDKVLLSRGKHTGSIPLKATD